MLVIVMEIDIHFDGAIHFTQNHQIEIRQKFRKMTFRKRDFRTEFSRFNKESTPNKGLDYFNFCNLFI